MKNNFSKFVHMEKKIKAIFRGQDGSCGYKTGKEYLLVIRHPKKGNIIIQKEIGITGECEYSSVIAFLNNWDNIVTT